MQETSAFEASKDVARRAGVSTLAEMAFTLVRGQRQCHNHLQAYIQIVLQGCLRTFSFWKLAILGLGYAKTDETLGLKQNATDKKIEIYIVFIELDT